MNYFILILFSNVLITKSLSYNDEIEYMLDNLKDFKSDNDTNCTNDYFELLNSALTGQDWALKGNIIYLKTNN
jgi:hypothetical protein